MKLALHLLAPVLPLLMSATMPPAPEHTGLPARPIEVEVGRWAAAPAQRVFTNKEEFEGYFGQRALGVDFRHEWVVLYAAGVKPTTGYIASIDEVVRTENEQSLKISTSLVHPGRTCGAEPKRSMPYALAAIPAMRVEPAAVRFASSASLAICN